VGGLCPRGLFYNLVFFLHFMVKHIKDSKIPLLEFLGSGVLEFIYPVAG
jgi:hypothetical protein